MFKQLKNNEGNTSKENKGFSIKALTFGVAVVVIGLVSLGLGGHTAFAETMTYPSLKSDNVGYQQGFNAGYQKGFEVGYLDPCAEASKLEDKRNDYKPNDETKQEKGYDDGYGTGFHEGVEAGQANRKKGNMFFTRKSWWRRFVDNIQDSWWNTKNWWEHTMGPKKDS
ncbi:FliH/SctL family protein [Streptococcus phocae]|uniref:Uncharacterized protein n=1 Tax=Streptococcus phocae TaxID=119224 RepID=A0A0P6S6D4_9STRE|nr:hypothetical protein [Streptococcus phocae]KPJ22717.1 hypothetical protein AKK44_03475 [Streptococcus phocae]